MKKTIAILALLVALAAAASAQSKSFQLGKWTEIQSAVLKELNRSYVDSLPVDRIERAGMDAINLQAGQGRQRDHQRALRGLPGA